MNQNSTDVTHAWQTYQKQLLSFVRGKVNKHEDAEDILNDVFVSLIKKADAQDMPKHVAGWLYHVTKNKIIDYYRTHKTFEALPEDLVAESKSEEQHSVGQLSHCLTPMIKDLPDIFQQVLMLSEIEGKTNKVVAEELGLSLSAVKSRILRGRKKLNQSILNCCTLYRNKAGEVVDYEQKINGYCHQFKN